MSREHKIDRPESRAASGRNRQSVAPGLLSLREQMDHLDKGLAARAGTGKTLVEVFMAEQTHREQQVQHKLQDLLECERRHLGVSEDQHDLLVPKAIERCSAALVERDEVVRRGVLARAIALLEAALAHELREW